MWRSLLTDLESVLKGAKPADLIRVPKPGPASRGEDAARVALVLLLLGEDEHLDLIESHLLSYAEYDNPAG